MKEIDNIFGPEGLIASKLPGYETRSGQIKMAAAAWHTVETNGTLIVEAGTGIGKSLAYLVPFIFWAVRNKKRVVISTFTKALQQQLIDSDLPFLSKTLPKDISFRWALCLGGQNYLCLRRLEQIRQLGIFESQEEIIHILDWRKKTETGMRGELDFEVSPGLWSQICRESDLCLSGKCVYWKNCFYQQARFAQYRAQILVVNHHLYFAHLASGEQVLPEFNGLVFDEAHTLEDVATDFLGHEVSNSGVKYVLDNIYNPRTGKGLLGDRLKNITSSESSRLQQLKADVQTTADAFFSNLTDRFGRESRSLRLRKSSPVPNILYEPLAALTVGLREIIKKADTQEEEIEIGAAYQRCETINDSLKHILEQDLADHVYWLEIQPRLRYFRITLKASPINVGEELKERVFSVIKPVVLTSATLTTEGHFDYIRERLGLDSWQEGKGRLNFCEELVVSSPFDYEKQAILYLPQGMPDPKEGSAYLDSLAECLKTLLPLTSEHRIQITEGNPQSEIRNQNNPQSAIHNEEIRNPRSEIRNGKGGTFVLFTSFAALNQVYERLKDTLADMDVFKQGELPTQRIIEKFKEGKQSILFGTNTFWQGVDVPGEDLVSVIITKLPFAVPDEPITQARTEYLAAKGKSPFWDYQIPQAVILLRQGFGRLIRTQKDRGMVTICDPRIRTKSYGRVFLDSLPHCRVTSKLEEVKEFFGLKDTSFNL